MFAAEGMTEVIQNADRINVNLDTLVTNPTVRNIEDLAYKGYPAQRTDNMTAQEVFRIMTNREALGKTWWYHSSLKEPFQIAEGQVTAKQLKDRW